MSIIILLQTHASGNPQKRSIMTNKIWKTKKYHLAANLLALHWWACWPKLRHTYVWTNTHTHAPYYLYTTLVLCVRKCVRKCLNKLLKWLLRTHMSTQTHTRTQWRSFWYCMNSIIFNKAHKRQLLMAHFAQACWIIFTNLHALIIGTFVFSLLQKSELIFPTLHFAGHFSVCANNPIWLSIK